MRKARRRRRRKESGIALIMLAPSLVIFGVFVFYPFLKNFYLGFYRSRSVPGTCRAPTSASTSIKDVLASTDFLDSLHVTIARSRS